MIVDDQLPARRRALLAAPRVWLAGHPWRQGALVALLVAAGYLVTASPSNPYDQFVRLADALLDGRTWIDRPPDYLELARYGPGGLPCAGADPGCRGFVVEPPMPAVLLLPWVVLFGTQVDQIRVAVLLAAVAVGLFWVATRRLGWTVAQGAAVTVLVAFGTNLWWAAGDGSVWTFAHVCAVLFLCAALVEGAGRRRAWLVGLLVGLAGLCRLPVFLAFPFFLVLVLAPLAAAASADPGGPDLRRWRALLADRAARTAVLGFGGGLGAAAVAVLGWNLLRYGTVADAGYDHPQYAELPWFADGRFSLTHVPRHIEALFLLAPRATGDVFPFFAPTVIGVALLLVSPALLYAAAARRGALQTAAAVSVVLVAVPHVLYGTTGWSQFGYRYALDYLVPLAVLVGSGMGPRPGVRARAAVGLSVCLAVWGPLFFFDTPLEQVLGLRWTLP